MLRVPRRHSHQPRIHNAPKRCHSKRNQRSKSPPRPDRWKRQISVPVCSSRNRSGKRPTNTSFIPPLPPRVRRNILHHQRTESSEQDRSRIFDCDPGRRSFIITSNIYKCSRAKPQHPKSEESRNAPRSTTHNALRLSTSLCYTINIQKQFTPGTTRACYALLPLSIHR